MASSFVLGMAVASSPYLLRAAITYSAEVTVRLVGRLVQCGVTAIRNLVTSDENEDEVPSFENEDDRDDGCVIWDARWNTEWQNHWTTYHEPRLFAEIRRERMGEEVQHLLPATTTTEDCCAPIGAAFGLFGNTPVLLTTNTFPSFNPPFEPTRIHFDPTVPPPATSSTIPCLHSYHHNEEGRIEIVIDSDTDSTGSDEISRRIMDEAGYLSRSLTLDDRADTPVPELSGDEGLEEEEVENDDIASVWSVVSESDTAVQGSSPESEKGPLPASMV